MFILAHPSLFKEMEQQIEQMALPPACDFRRANATRRLRLS
jgi:hypothetical protein